MRTMTARAETGVAFIAELRGGGSVARPVATVTASGNGHRLVTTFNGRGHGNRPTGEPLTTVTTIACTSPTRSNGQGSRARSTSTTHAGSRNGSSRG